MLLKNLTNSVLNQVWSFKPVFIRISGFCSDEEGDLWFREPARIAHNTRLKQYRGSVVWNLEFDLLPTGVQAVQANIIHMTEGGNWQNIGDRYPFVYIYARGTSGYLMIQSYVSGDSLHTYRMPNDLNTLSWNHIQIQQFMREQKVIYKSRVIHFG